MQQPGTSAPATGPRASSETSRAAGRAPAASPRCPRLLSHRAACATGLPAGCHTASAARRRLGLRSSSRSLSTTRWPPRHPGAPGCESHPQNPVTVLEQKSPQMPLRINPQWWVPCRATKRQPSVQQQRPLRVTGGQGQPEGASRALEPSHRSGESPTGLADQNNARGLWDTQKCSLRRRFQGL